MKRDRPGEYRPDSHYQQQSYQTLHSPGRSFLGGPTFYMTTEFELSVIVRLFALRGRIQMCVFGGRGVGWGLGSPGRREGDKGEWEIPLPIPNTDVLRKASTAREVRCVVFVPVW